MQRIFRRIRWSDWPGRATDEHRSWPRHARTSEQLLLRNALASIPVHIEESLSKLLLEMLTGSQKVLYNNVSTALGTLMPGTVRNVVSLPEFMWQFSNAVFNNHGLLTLVPTPVRSEQSKHAEKQSRIENSCRQHVNAGIIADTRPVAWYGSDQSPTDIPDDKTSRRAYCFRQFRSDYRNDWQEARASRAVPATTLHKPYRNKPFPTYKP